MKMRRLIDGIVVEWDVNKEKINIAKHKLDFRTAILVFTDQNRVEFYDYKHSEKEHRYMVIGMVDNIITVIYTERGKNIRIISARSATAEERKRYYGKNC